MLSDQKIGGGHRRRLVRLVSVQKFKVDVARGEDVTRKAPSLGQVRQAIYVGSTAQNDHRSSIH